MAKVAKVAKSPPLCSLVLCLAVLTVSAVISSRHFGALVSPPNQGRPRIEAFRAGRLAEGVEQQPWSKKNARRCGTGLGHFRRDFSNAVGVRTRAVG